MNISGGTTGDMGIICPPPEMFCSPPQFTPRIISSVLKLAKIWQFQYKNGKFVHALHAFFTFLPLKNFSSPFASQNFDTGTTTDEHAISAV